MLRVLLIAVPVLGLGLLGFNCSRFKIHEPAGVSSSTSASSSVPAEQPSTVALMSAEQMLKTMISVTGTEGLGELTSASDTDINRAYVERSGSLPSGQDPKSATGPTLIAATNVASTVCAKAVDRDRAVTEAEKANRLFFREFDFSRGLSGQASDAVEGGFKRLARNAWRRDPSQDELNSLVQFAQDFAVGANATDPAQTRLLAISVCTVAVSTLDALTY